MAEHREAEFDRLPMDLVAHILVFLYSLADLAHASGVCTKWKVAVHESIRRRENLKFSSCKMDGDSVARLVRDACSLKGLDISRVRWDSRITNIGLYKLSRAKCVSNLTSISLWGMTGITDKGVFELISRAVSLQHINVGGTFITDESLYTIADCCPHLKSIILWSCRSVSENGVIEVIKKCQNLQTIVVWGTRVHADCFIRLHTLNPSLKINHSCHLFAADRF